MAITPLNDDGLSIIETIGAANDGGETATVIKLGSWTDENHSVDA
jgi:hypothetical protein